MDEICSTKSDSRGKTLFYEWTRDNVMNEIINGKSKKNKLFINKIKLNGTSNCNKYMKTLSNEIKKKINDKILPTIKLNKVNNNSIMEYSNKKQSTLSQKRSQSGTNYKIPNNLYYEERIKNNNFYYYNNNKKYNHENYFNNKEKNNIFEEYNKFNPINNNKSRNFTKSKSIYDKDNEKIENNIDDSLNSFIKNLFFNHHHNKKLILIKNNQYSNEHPYNIYREKKTSNYNPNPKRAIFRQTSIRNILNNYNENNQKPIKIGSINNFSFKKYNVDYTEEDYIRKKNEIDFWNIIGGNEQNIGIKNNYDIYRNEYNNNINYIDNERNQENEKNKEEDFHVNNFILNDKKDDSLYIRNEIINTSDEGIDNKNEGNKKNMNDNAIIDDDYINKENEVEKGDTVQQNFINDESSKSKENLEDIEKKSNVSNISKSKSNEDESMNFKAISNDDDNYENEFDKSKKKENEDKCYDNSSFISVD